MLFSRFGSSVRMIAFILLPETETLAFETSCVIKELLSAQKSPSDEEEALIGAKPKSLWASLHVQGLGDSVI
jgi:hypothetical protein